MKRLILMAVGLVLLLALPGAAVFAHGGSEFGFKGGMSLANLSGDDSEGLGTRTGFGAGVFFSKMVSNSVAIQPELVYVMKGAKEEEMGVTLTIKADYIEIPLLLKFIVPTEGNFKPNFFFGPVLGINTGAKMDISVFGQSIDFDVANNKSTDFGVTFGGGFGVAVGSGQMIFDARYTLGLSNILDDVNPDDFVDLDDIDSIDDIPTELPLANIDGSALDIKNAVFSFFVGFAFPIGGK